MVQRVCQLEFLPNRLKTLCQKRLRKPYRRKTFANALKAANQNCHSVGYYIMQSRNNLTNFRITNSHPLALEQIWLSVLPFQWT